jgi:hypothetical protein
MLLRRCRLHFLPTFYRDGHMKSPKIYRMKRVSQLSIN